MRAPFRLLARILVLFSLAVAGLSAPLLFGLSTANAALNETCFLDTTTYVPGVYDENDVCVPGAPPLDGAACGSYEGFFYNANDGRCFANNTSCTVNGNTGYYNKGVCTLPVAPVPASPPQLPDAFTIDPNGGATPPTGYNAQQPMCVNGAPFVGGGMFVVVGAVICHTGLTRQTGIYAYFPGYDPDDLGNQAGGGYWDSISLENLYAAGDITALGTLSVYGGAQLFSLNGKNGLQVNDTQGILALSLGDDDSIARLSVKAETGVDIEALVENGGPGVSIYGAIGDTSTAATGVIIQGDGKGALPTPANAQSWAPWADVAVASKSFTQTNGLGSGVVVNDYGVKTKVGADTAMTIVRGALDFATVGNSNLTNPAQAVSGGTTTTMAGSNANHLVVDDNGRMSVANGVAQQASAGTYIVNGYGNTNGVVATERNATLSGGESNPTSMVLSDGGARFSNSSTGGPVVVSGIADGQGPNDAANIRQLHSGLASVAALAGIPAPQLGKKNSIGIGMGHHGSATAVALGGQSMLGDAFTVKYGGAVSYSSGLVETTASVGMGLSW